MRRAFTLIELLIVIAIIGILSSIVAVSYPNYTKRARDTQRKSDLKQYQVALEISANKNNSIYPLTASGRLSSVITGGPEDPKYAADATYFYKYLSDASGLNYVVWAKLEKPVTTGNSWISCSNGKIGESATVNTDCSGI